MQGIKLTLDPKSIEKIKNDFNRLIKELETIGQVNVDINLKDFQNQMNEVEQQAQKTKLQIERILGKPIKINDNLKQLGFDDFQKRVEQIKASVDKLANVKINTNKQGEITSAVIRYTDATGKSVIETWKLIETLDKVNNKKIIAFQPVGQTFIDDVERKAKLANNELVRLSKLGEEIKSNLTVKSSESEIQSFLGANFKGVEITSINEKLLNTGKALKEVEFRVREGQDKWHLYKLAIDETTGQTRLLDKGLKDVLNRQVSFSEQVKIAITRMAEWAIAGTALYGTLRKIREGIQFINEIDKELTTIRMITGMDNNQVQGLAKQFNELAKSLGTTTEKVAQGSVEFFRMGKTAEETSKLIEATIMASNLSGVSTEQMSQYITATMNGFQMQANEVMRIVDTFVTIDNNAATSFAELAEAFQHTANSAKQTGVDFETLAAWIGTVSSVTRKSASTIGESFKTMFARLTDLKAGKLDEEGMAISDVETALGKVGIALRDSKNSFREMDDVINDLAKRWKDLTEIQQSEISKAIAGTRQRENFLALMNNYNMALELEKKALDSAGSSQERYKIYLESTEAKMNQLKATTEEFWLHLINSSAIKSGITALTGFIGLLDQLIIQSKASGLAVVALSAAIIRLVTAFNELRKQTEILAGLKVFLGLSSLSLSSIGTALAGLLNPITILIATLGVLTYAIIKHNIEARKTKEEYAKLTETVNQFNEAMQQNNTEMLKQSTQSLETYQKKLNELREKALAHTTRHTREGFEVDSQEMQNYKDFIKTLEKVGLTVDETTGKIVELGVAQNNLKIYDEIKAFQEQQQAIVDNKERLISLINQYLSLNDVQNKSIDQKKQMSAIAKELSKSLENIEVTYDKQGNAIVTNIKALETEKEILYKSRDAVIETSNAKIKAWQESMQVIVNGQVMTVKAAKNEVEALQQVVKAYTESLNAMIQIGYATNYIPKNILNSLTRMFEIQKKLNEIKGSFDFLNIQSSGNTGSYTPTKINNTNTNNSNKSSLITPIDLYQSKINNLLETLDNYNNKLQELQKTAQKYKDEGNFEKALEIEQKLIKEQQNEIENLQKKQKELQGVGNNIAKEFKSKFGLDITKMTDYQLDVEFNKRFAGKIGDNYKKSADVWNKLVDDYKQYGDAVKRINEEIIKSEENLYNIRKEKLQLSMELNKKYVNELKNIFDELDDNIKQKSKTIGVLDENDYSGKKAAIVEYIKNLEIELESAKYIVEQLTQLRDANTDNLELYDMINEQIKDYSNKINSLNYELIESAKDYRDVLKQEYEYLEKKELEVLKQQKEIEFADYESRIKKLKAEIEALRNTLDDDRQSLAEMEKELEQWRKDDSKFSKQKQAELEKKISEKRKEIMIAEKEQEIKNIEETKQAREDWYDSEEKRITTYYNNLLAQTNLYKETSDMIVENGFKNLHNLLLAYSVAYKNVAAEIGKGFEDNIIPSLNKIIGKLQEIFEQMAQLVKSSMNISIPTINIPTSTSITTNNNTATLSNGTTISYNASTDTYTIKNGNSTTYAQYDEGMYILSRRMQKFDTGGLTSNSGLAYVHAKERVLNPQQTKAFDYLVYNILPFFKNLKYPDTKKTEINAPLVQNEIHNHNYTPFDLNNANDNLVRLFKNELHRIGYGISR